MKIISVSWKPGTPAWIKIAFWLCLGVILGVMALGYAFAIYMNVYSFF